MEDSITQSSTPARSATLMLFVFLAYLVYLPIHAVSGEHCLPGVAHIESECVHLAEGEDPTPDQTGHSHHERPDGTTHHNHHSAADHEVESTGKVGLLKWVDVASSVTVHELSHPTEFRLVHCSVSSEPHDSFTPEKWLISRGPPLA